MTNLRRRLHRAGPGLGRRPRQRRRATWLTVRSQAWREAVEVVAIDPSAAFRRALRGQLPRAAVSVDAFPLVKLGNDAPTRVRQRV